MLVRDVLLTPDIAHKNAIDKRMATSNNDDVKRALDEEVG